MPVAAPIGNEIDPVTDADPDDLGGGAAGVPGPDARAGGGAPAPVDPFGGDPFGLDPFGDDPFGGDPFAPDPLAADADGALMNQDVPAPHDGPDDQAPPAITQPAPETPPQPEMRPAPAPQAKDPEINAQRAQALRDAMADLAADPTGYQFLAATRLIQAANPDKPRIGASDRISQDPVRFGQIPTLSFAASELRHFRRREDKGPMEMMGFHFGVFGPDGALPEFVTEELLVPDDDGYRDEATPAFINIFHHRLTSLLYAAWERAQIAVGRDRPGADPWEGWLGAVQGAHGADPRAWQSRDHLPEELRRRLSGWFASGPKSAAGVESVATEAIGAPVTVDEFCGEWLPIAKDQRARFASPENFGAEGGMRLGQDILVGDRYYSLQTRLRLRTAPISLLQYRDLLRTGQLFPVLRDAMRGFLGLAVGWELQIVLDVGEAPTPKLDGSLRLGWDIWMSDSPPMRDLDDLSLEGTYAGPGAP
jgi:type VI secretion system protein ImpH